MTTRGKRRGKKYNIIIHVNDILYIYGVDHLPCFLHAKKLPLVYIKIFVVRRSTITQIEKLYFAVYHLNGGSAPAQNTTYMQYIL